VFTEKARKGALATGGHATDKHDFKNPGELLDSFTGLFVWIRKIEELFKSNINTRMKRDSNYSLSERILMSWNEK
jgi:hypothetical protein